MGRFSDRLRTGDVCVGLMATIPHRTAIEVLGFVGLDFACIDQMFGPSDWNDVANMVRGAQVFGLDPLVRISAYPWVGAPDRRLAVDAARAFSLGATGVVFSSGQAIDVEQVVHAAATWHKDVHIHPFSRDDYGQYSQKVSDDRYAIPLIESEDGVRNIEEILDVEGLKVLWLGLSDLSRVLGHPFDYEHPDVWRLIDRTVEKAHAKGIAIAGNVGYEFSKDIDAISGRVKRLRDHGIEIIWLQNLGFLIQWYLRDVISHVRDQPATDTVGVKRSAP